MSQVLVTGMYNQNFEDCPRYRWAAALVANWGKSVVQCWGEVLNANWVNVNAELLYEANTERLLPWCWLIRFVYPKWVWLNKDWDCDQLAYVPFKIKQTCDVWTWAAGQCLMIRIPNNFAVYEYTPSWINGTTGAWVAQIWWFDPASPPSNNYIAIAKNTWTIVSGDFVYGDMRCFENDFLSLKKTTCVKFVWEWVLDVWDAVVINEADWTILAADSNAGAVRQEFCWILLSISWTSATIQTWGCVETFDWEGSFPVDWVCAYLSTIRWSIIPRSHNSFDPTNCYPIWKYICWKLRLSPLAGCMVDVIKSIKALDWTANPDCVELSCATNFVVDTIWDTPMSHLCMYEEGTQYNSNQNLAADQVVATFKAECAWRYFVCFEWRRDPAITSWTLTWQRVVVNGFFTASWWVGWVSTARQTTCVTTSNVPAWWNITFAFQGITQFNCCLQMRRIRIYKKVCAKSPNIVKL